MRKNPLRIITLTALFLIILTLVFFSNANRNMIISIALILIFLMIFTYVFKVRTSDNLKVFIILFSFIGLPLFLLFYLNVFNSLLGSIAAGIIVIVCGIASIITIIQLEYVELVR